MSRFPGRPARLVAILCLVPAVLLAGAWSAELGARIWRMAEVRADIEPRHARLAGIQARGEDIVTADRVAAEWLARHAYPASADISEIGTELQQRVRRLAEAAEVRVAGSQILPAREETGFSVITVAGTLEGETGALTALLLALQAEDPPIVVEKLAVQAPRARRGGEAGAEVNAQANMSVLRLAP